MTIWGAGLNCWVWMFCCAVTGFGAGIATCFCSATGCTAGVVKGCATYSVFVVVAATGSDSIAGVAIGCAMGAGVSTGTITGSAISTVGFSSIITVSVTVSVAGSVGSSETYSSAAINILSAEDTLYAGLVANISSSVGISGFGSVTGSATGPSITDGFSLAGVVGSVGVSSVGSAVSWAATGSDGSATIGSTVSTDWTTVSSICGCGVPNSGVPVFVFCWYIHNVNIDSPIKNINNI